MSFDVVVHLTMDEDAALYGVRFFVGLLGGTANVEVSTRSGELLMADELNADPDAGAFEVAAALPLEAYRVDPSRYEVPLVVTVSSNEPAIAYVAAIANLAGPGCEDGELTLDVGSPGDTGDTSEPLDTGETGRP